MKKLYTLLYTLKLNPRLTITSLLFLAGISIVLETFGLYVLKLLLESFNSNSTDLGFIGFIIVAYIGKVFISISVAKQLQTSLFRIQSSISSKIFGLVLKQPYPNIRSNNSDFYLRSIISLPSQIVVGGLLPLSIVVIDGLTIMMIVIYSVFLIGPPAFVSYLFLFIASLLVFFLGKRSVSAAGVNFDQLDKARTGIITSVLDDIKFYKVNSSSFRTFDFVSDLNVQFSHALCSLEIAKTVPRFWIELAAVFVISIAIVLNFLYPGSFGIEKLSLLGLFVFRLMPSLNRLLGSVNYLSFIGPSIEDLNLNIVNLQQNKPFDDRLIAKPVPVGVDIVIHSTKTNRHLTFTLMHGVVNILLAPSGWGKTYLLDILAGLNIDEADSLFSQLAKHNALPSILGQHAYISQHSKIGEGYFILDCENNSCISSDKFYEYLNFLLPDFLNKLPFGANTFFGPTGYMPSGGEMKRLNLAMILSSSPSLLFVDEVTTGLDHYSLALVTKCLEAYASSGSIVVAISHDDHFSSQANRLFLSEDLNSMMPLN